MTNGTEEFRTEHIEEMLKWDLDKKINHALKRIQEFYKAEDGLVYIAFSGGKDSTVLLHLVRSLYPEVEAVFCNTTNEFVEVLSFVKQTENVVTVHPEMSFNKTVEVYGFPLVSKKVSKAILTLRAEADNTKATRNLYMTGYNRKGHFSQRWKLAKKWLPLIKEAEFNITSKCCDILKKDPTKKYEKETGKRGFIGTMASDSIQRRSTWLKMGCNTYEGTSVKSRPLSVWTSSDIWEYIERFSVPYSKIYDDIINEETGEVLIEGEHNTGCAYCAFGAHLEKSDLVTKNRFQRLALRKPKQFKKMMNLKNNGVTFSEALSFIKVNH